MLFNCPQATLKQFHRPKYDIKPELFPECAFCSAFAIVYAASVLKFVLNLNRHQFACAMLDDVPEQSRKSFLWLYTCWRRKLWIIAIFY